MKSTSSRVSTYNVAYDPSLIRAHPKQPFIAVDGVGYMSGPESNVIFPKGEYIINRSYEKARESTSDMVPL